MREQCAVPGCANLAQYRCQSLSGPAFFACRSCNDVYSQAIGYRSDTMKSFLNIEAELCKFCPKAYQFVCLCEAPLLQLCENHRNPHIGHSIHPRKSIPKFVGQEEVEQFRKRQGIIDEVVQTLTKEIQRAESFYLNLDREIDILITQIQAWKEMYLGLVQVEIDQLKTTVRLFENRLSDVRYNASRVPANNLEAVIDELSEGQAEHVLIMFSSYLRVSTVLDNLHTCVSMKTDHFWTQKPIFSSGNSLISTLPKSDLGYFLPFFHENELVKVHLNPGIRTHTPLSLDPVDRHFRWCVSASGALILSGGLKSRKTFIIPGPEFTESTRLPDMIMIRGDHGVIYKAGTLYAFGGFDGKSRLASCEKLLSCETSPGPWVSIGKMDVGRSGFTPCESGGKVYLIGGVNVLKAEVYDIQEERFRVFDWKLSSGEATTVIVIGDKIHIFQKNQHLLATSESAPSPFAPIPESVYRSCFAPMFHRGKWHFFSLRGEHWTPTVFDTVNFGITQGVELSA